jgi:hypothetical protein
LEAEDMTVSVFPCQGAIFADEITVTYLESGSEEEMHDELHGGWGSYKEIVFRNGSLIVLREV